MKETKAGSEEEGRFLILPDTSWLVAILDEKDSHHTAATSSLGALLPYKPKFYVPVLVALELMSRLIRVNKIPVKSARSKILRLIGEKLTAHGRVKKHSFDEIFDNYIKCSRQEIKKLTAIDFLVVTEGIALDAKILTCDLKMYNSTKKYYKAIYFMSDKVSSQGSDLGRLIYDIQNIRR